MEIRCRKRARKANWRVREVGKEGVQIELPLTVAKAIGNPTQLMGEFAQEARLLLISAAMNAEGVQIAAAIKTLPSLRSRESNI